MFESNKKGALLFIVLATIIVVVTLSIVILRIMLSQSRLTHHQVSRIQAQYAAKAGVLYALDKLRLNNDPCWQDRIPVALYVRNMRRLGDPSFPTCDIIEPDLPLSIDHVEITVDVPASGVSGTRKVSAKTIYTYTP